MNEKIKEVEKQYEDAKIQLHDFCISEIEKIARETLKTSIADEFIMGMGTIMFCKNDEILHNYENKEIKNILDKYDDQLSLLGNAMRFKKDMPKITEW